MKTHDMLADAFLQEGVDTCFALLGDANMAWCGAMAERGCEFVYVRHEHCAAAAAMAAPAAGAALTASAAKPGALPRRGAALSAKTELTDAWELSTSFDIVVKSKSS